MQYNNNVNIGATRVLVLWAATILEQPEPVFAFSYSGKLMRA